MLAQTATQLQEPPLATPLPATPFLTQLFICHHTSQAAAAAAAGPTVLPSAPGDTATAAAHPVNDPHPQDSAAPRPQHPAAPHPLPAPTALGVTVGVQIALAPWQHRLHCCPCPVAPQH
jgi:hypothetical protein